MAVRIVVASLDRAEFRFGVSLPLEWCCLQLLASAGSDPYHQSGTSIWLEGQYNQLFRAGACLTYAYFTMGAPMKSNDYMHTEYTIQFTEIELMIWLFSHAHIP